MEEGDVSQLWNTFQLKITELFTVGHRLPYSLQLEAVKKVDEQTTKWRRDLRLERSPSSHGEDGTTSEVESSLGISGSQLMMMEGQNIDLRSDNKVLTGSEKVPDEGSDSEEGSTIVATSVQNKMVMTKGRSRTRRKRKSAVKKSSPANSKPHAPNNVSKLKADCSHAPNDVTNAVMKMESKETDVDKLEINCCILEQIENAKLLSDGNVCGDSSMASLDSENDLHHDGMLKTGVSLSGVGTNKSFPCSFCDKRFAHKSNLLSHVQIHKKGPLKCTDCDKEFFSRGGLSLHRKSHQPSEACPYCDHLAPNASYLKKHVDIKHFKEDVTRRRYSCDQCKARFYTKYHLERHLECHSKTKTFQCPHCTHSTHSEMLLKRHLSNMHTSRDPYVCNICGATTKFKMSLIEHQRRHYNDKPYKCTECSYCAVSSSNVARHSLIHKGRTYQCDVCQKKFVYKSHLKRHQVIHTGEKIFTCLECSYSCNVSSNLRKHMSLVHKRILPPRRGGKQIPRLDEIIINDHSETSGLDNNQSQDGALINIASQIEAVPQTTSVYLFSDTSKVPNYVTS